ncbi:hypothetical protein B0A49_05297 [Cryomyces minteri]|uniref:BZIP domain-containing protein n=1 Tax=Cryomyces minteri TaxID=331657 RepID=A0A4U0XE67_9PEZI|nr:hypothetical protein B0A49_05297 [Cryomyces minteri]
MASISPVDSAHTSRDSPHSHNNGGYADGQTPKRRGPKPDSKPALTRRQELNRQAQRTHRERKEMYIKALEQEVLRLKETFGTTARERDAVQEENRRLKELLAAHGISYDFSSPSHTFQRNGSSYDRSSRGSFTGSYGPPSNSTGFSPPPQAPSQPLPPQPAHAQKTSHPPSSQNRPDYDQVGIDFVLTLERPCMDHMQFLMVRSQNPDALPFHHPSDYADSDQEPQISGHALMATCPPESYVLEHPNDMYPHKMPDMPVPDLMKLLDLSNRLPLDGEITPVMAWTMILRNERCRELGTQDFELIKQELTAKVRCYGFGAVLEEFEVRDALNSVLASKTESYVGRN